MKKKAKEEEKAKKAAEKQARLDEEARKREEEAKKKAAEEEANVSLRRCQHIRRISDRDRIYKDFAKQYYGKLPLNQSQERVNRPRAGILSLSNRVGEKVLFRARVQTSRAQGNKMVFFNLRQRIDTIQGVLVVTDGKVSKPMVKWAASIPDESIVLVEGTVEKAQEEIKSTTFKDIEIHISQVSRAA